MKHYEFCVDLIDGDDDGDDDTYERFGAVSCAACTEVNFSTFISTLYKYHPTSLGKSSYRNNEIL